VGAEEALIRAAVVKPRERAAPREQLVDRLWCFARTVSTTRGSPNR